METKILLLAGIAAAAKWAIWPDDVRRILEIPPGKRNWYVPLGWTHADKPVQEEIQLEHYKVSKGEGLWMGYGPRSNVLIFSHELPLGTPEEEQ